METVEMLDQETTADQTVIELTHRQVLRGWMTDLMDCGSELTVMAVILGGLLQGDDEDLKHHTIKAIATCRQQCLSAAGLDNICKAGAVDELAALIAIEAINASKEK
jgi:hypothetical protein